MRPDEGWPGGHAALHQALENPQPHPGQPAHAGLLTVADGRGLLRGEPSSGGSCDMWCLLAEHRTMVIFTAARNGGASTHLLTRLQDAGGKGGILLWDRGWQIPPYSPGQAGHLLRRGLCSENGFHIFKRLELKIKEYYFMM